MIYSLFPISPVELLLFVMCQSEWILEAAEHRSSSGSVELDAGKTVVSSINPAEFTTIWQNSKAVRKMNIFVQEDSVVLSVQVDTSDVWILAVPVGIVEMASVEVNGQGAGVDESFSHQRLLVLSIQRSHSDLIIHRVSIVDIAR